MSRQARKDEKAEKKRARKEAEDREQGIGTTDAPTDTDSQPGESSQA